MVQVEYSQMRFPSDSSERVLLIQGRFSDIDNSLIQTDRQTHIQATHIHPATVTFCIRMTTLLANLATSYEAGGTLPAKLFILPKGSLTLLCTCLYHFA